MKSLCTRCLTKCELETALSEVEACINSRPLTYVNEDPNVNDRLTPSHNLIGRVAGFQPHVFDTDKFVNFSHNDLNERELIRRRQLDKFWNVWIDDYKRNVPPSVKGFKSNCNVKKSSVVLLREENVPKMNWPLGIITHIFPSCDGVVRCVNVTTAKGVLRNPIQKLHDFMIFYDIDCANGHSEISIEPLLHDEKEGVSESDENETLTQVRTTRRGRVVKSRLYLICEVYFDMSYLFVFIGA